MHQRPINPATKNWYSWHRPASRHSTTSTAKTGWTPSTSSIDPDSGTRTIGFGWAGSESGVSSSSIVLLLDARTQESPASAAAFSHLVGDLSVLGTIKYIITLDTDTQLPRDSAKTLIGNMAHPLNRPVYDEKKGRVVDGYTILQPRASTSLTSRTGSRFTRLFAGEAGIDPYTREISDVYQDLFGEGSFVGKGIYDVASFAQASEGRFPENLIWSHDLIEEAYARSALVTDVDLIEIIRSHYPMEASRAPWDTCTGSLPAGYCHGCRTWGASANPTPVPARHWKLLDNIRAAHPVAFVAVHRRNGSGVRKYRGSGPLLVAGAFFVSAAAHLFL